MVGRCGVWGDVGLHSVALAVREGCAGCAGAGGGIGPALSHHALTNARLQAHWERPQQHVCQAGEADHL